jgi:hypothetical protein
LGTPTEAASQIVADWHRWADRGMYVGHVDKVALADLTAKIAEALMAAAKKKAKP